MHGVHGAWTPAKANMRKLGKHERVLPRTEVPPTCVSLVVTESLLTCCLSPLTTILQVSVVAGEFDHRSSSWKLVSSFVPTMAASIRGFH